jgi:ribose transport system substrate-binding protein
LKKLIRALMVAIALTASIGLIAACSSDDSDSDSDSDGGASTTATTDIPSLDEMSLDGKQIGFVNAGPLEYYDFSEESAKLAVEELGGTFKAYNSNFDVQEEQAQVRNAITQGADGVIIIPLSTAGVATDLNLLKQAGIPGVMVYGWDPPQLDNAAGFVQVNFFDYGKIVGEEMAKIVPDDGDVAIITGLPGRAEIPQGSAGFKDGFGDDSRVVAEVPGDWSRQKAFDQTKTLMTKFPNLKGIFAQNDDMGVGVVQALGPKIDDVAVGSMNGSPIGLDMLEQGKFSVEAGNSIPIEEGQAVRYVASAINDIALEPKVCYTDIALVEDVDTWDKTWVPSSALAQEGLEEPCVEGATDPQTVEGL